MPLSSVEETVEVRVGVAEPPSFLTYLLVGGSITAFLVAVFISEVK